MRRRSFIRRASAGAVAPALHTSRAYSHNRTNEPLSNDYGLLWESPDSATVTAGKAVLAILPSGRLVAGHSLNDRNAAHYTFRKDSWGQWRNRLYYSDDQGSTWIQTVEHPINNPRLIRNGHSLYLVGGSDGMQALRSDDGGESWEGPFAIVEDGIWYAEPMNCLFANGKVYFAMNKITERVRPADRGFYAPVVFSARIGEDWTQPDAWTLSNVYTYHDAVSDAEEPNLVGIPFYPYGFHSDRKEDRRPMYGIGWWEPNIVQITDPEHIWYDPEGRTFQIFQRAPVGKTNIAALCRVTEARDGSLTVSLQYAPSGEPMVFIPFPGGHGMFNMQYDEQTKLYWLLSQQSYDSMKKIDLFNPKRWNLGHHERHRFALHFSKNCVDWCFAGLLANAGDVGQSRHCASFVFDGPDLHWLSRSAGPNARNAHDADMITFHTVRNFRELVY
ncbi:hypothetical protein ES708_23544 [subsurface metagenome]